jgi:hypothetical protein
LIHLCKPHSFSTRKIVIYYSEVFSEKSYGMASPTLDRQCCSAWKEESLYSFSGVDTNNRAPDVTVQVE